jgi:hypothetical protein
VEVVDVEVAIERLPERGERAIGFVLDLEEAVGGEVVRVRPVVPDLDLVPQRPKALRRRPSLVRDVVRRVEYPHRADSSERGLP